MHSLHHSDPDVNVSTTVRHYWAERLIKSVTIYAAVGLVFKVDLTVVNLYALISFYNYFSHMHVKVGYGRWAVLLNSPQYHRIHHSVLAEHYDCNFAALFPIFDRLFGTYRQPLPGQFPPTGLDGAEAPADLWQSLAWPARGLVRSRLARALREPRP
jgi:sterol desaturase/sphingolipid hydroxylase (fatty acid hydroxylase superfamily)